MILDFIPAQQISKKIDSFISFFMNEASGEPAQVHDALQRTLPETPILIGMAFFWTQAGSIIAFMATGAAWGAAWIATDFVLSLVRIELRRRHLKARNRQLRNLSISMICANFAWYFIIALGSMACLLTGDVRLTAVALILAVGFCGYISSRSAAFPRFAIASLYTMGGGLTIGLLGSPLHPLFLLGLMAPAVSVAYHTLMLMNHEVLVVALHSKEESKRLSRTDPLTGLANRMEMSEQLSDMCGYLKGASNMDAHGFAVLCLDLDGFKLVNDCYGHMGGDMVLKKTAEQLQNCVRAQDLVCRIGGDEFVILMPGAARHDAIKLANSLLSAVAQQYDFGKEKRASVGLSIGIALAPEHDTLPEGILCKADEALYSVKYHGKGDWAVWSPEFKVAPNDGRPIDIISGSPKAILETLPNVQTTIPEKTLRRVG